MYTQMPIDLEIEEFPIIKEKKKRTQTPKKKEGEDREVIIYKIEIDGTDYLYVGSTQDYEQRKQNHCSSCRHNLNPKSKSINAKCPLYIEINKHGGWTKAIMTPLEKINVKFKIDARIREQYWIDKIQVARRDSIMLNGNRAHVPRELAIKEAKEQAKEYYEQNQKRLCAKSKEFYEKTKKVITCECGSEIFQLGKSHHIKTKKHQKWIIAEDDKFAKRLEEELDAMLDE